MCTSTALKPARMNARAISNWLFTPCSRRMRTRGFAPFAMYGAATSSVGSNVSRADRPRVARVALRGVLLVRAARVVAQLLHLVADARPHLAQRHRVLLQEDLPALPHPHRQRRARPAQLVAVRAQPVLRQHLAHPLEVRRLHLQHRAQLLVEERRHGIRAQRGHVHLEAAVAREGHLHQRGEEATVGAVVVGQHQARLVERLHRGEEARERLGALHVRAARAHLRVRLRQHRAAQPLLAARQVHEHQPASPRPAREAAA